MRGKPKADAGDVEIRRIIPARAGQTCRRALFARRPADHPRACGANADRVENRFTEHGSSPRVRGKPAATRDQDTQTRIIPARAGQTWRRRPIRTRCPDHPRACGANRRPRHRRSNSSGSSPRVRGKPRRTQRARRARRIIPARAGQTYRMDTITGRQSDHPRACGANPGLEGPRAWYYGSSPRVRGKPMPVTNVDWETRIIPARAGQTQSVNGHHDYSQDHPRACGANGFVPAFSGVTSGSSPRVRGKQQCGGDFGRARRIIPARAGQTRIGTMPSPAYPDHPRACGANVCRLSGGVCVIGSSPRVRGKPSKGVPSALGDRIIPARAGQTICCDCCHTGEPDHPRACGANRKNCPNFDVATGSSPRVRGKLAYDQFFSTECRIIPARAGQTRPV